MLDFDFYIFNYSFFLILCVCIVIDVVIVSLGVGVVRAVRAVRLRWHIMRMINNTFWKLNIRKIVISGWRLLLFHIIADHHALTHGLLQSLPNFLDLSQTVLTVRIRNLVLATRRRRYRRTRHQIVRNKTTGYRRLAHFHFVRIIISL